MGKAALPLSVAAMPFLFARPQPADPAWNQHVALIVAAAAERARDERSNTGQRLAYLLCELGFQLARRRIDPSSTLQLSRIDIAAQLGVNLCRVKRSLALLALKDIVESNARSLRVLDWPGLCSIAGYDPRRLELKEEDEQEEIATPAEPDRSPRLVTMAGDPACFV